MSDAGVRDHWFYTEFQCTAHDGWVCVRKDDPDHDLIVAVRICARCLNMLAVLDPDREKGAG
jgi:hypothetical protein